MAINDQYTGDFFPGISSGAEGLFRAPGSAGASGSAADSAGTTVTPPWGGSQDRYPASTGGTVQPGQNEDGFAGMPESFTTSTGAGRGNPDPYDHPSGG